MNTLHGIEIRDVPPDWVGRLIPKQDEQAEPILRWWARHPDGRLTPVYKGSKHPITGRIEP